MRDIPRKRSRTVAFTHIDRRSKPFGSRGNTIVKRTVTEVNTTTMSPTTNNTPYITYSPIGSYQRRVRRQRACAPRSLRWSAQRMRDDARSAKDAAILRATPDGGHHGPQRGEVQPSRDASTGRLPCCDRRMGRRNRRAQHRVLDEHRIWKGKAPRAYPRVTVQPCNARGIPKPNASPVDATERIVADDEYRTVQARVIAKYGIMTKVTRFLQALGGIVKRERLP